MLALASVTGSNAAREVLNSGFQGSANRPHGGAANHGRAADNTGATHRARADGGAGGGRL